MPTPAAEAFARKNGVSVAELKVEATPKGEYLFAEVSSKGRARRGEVIAEELPKELAGIYWAKNMRWHAGAARSLCAAGAVDGVSAGRGRCAGGIRREDRWARATRGHRVLCGDKSIRTRSSRRL